MYMYMQGQLRTASQSFVFIGMNETKCYKRLPNSDLLGILFMCASSHK